MTEEDWLKSTRISPMLYVVGKKSKMTPVARRKYRLFACVCASHWEREFFELDSRFSELIKAAEAYANGELHSSKFRLAVAAAQEAIDTGASNHKLGQSIMFVAEKNAWQAANLTAHRISQFHSEMGYSHEEAELRDQLDEEFAYFFREIFGNPFRPVTIDPRWLTANVTDLSRTIYQERAFDRMPILGDALLDAGCDHAELIDHCKNPRLTHVRGCWVVDLLNGKG